MKKFLLLCVCAFICQFVNAQVEKGHNNKFPFPYDVQPSELDIKGNISNVLYYHYSLRSEFGDIVVGSQSDTAYLEYDDNGHLVTYTTQGNFILYCPRVYNYSLKYDDKGNLMTLNNNLEYFYENGQLVKVHCLRELFRLYYVNGALSKIDYYNYQTQELRGTYYYQNGDWVKYRLYPGLFNAKEIVETYTYRNHKVTNWNGKVYTYNEKGLYSPTGNEKYTYEYDERGNWIKRYEIKKDKYGRFDEGYMTIRKITYR